MKIDSVTEEKSRIDILKCKIPLGLYQEKELPILFTATEEALDKKISFEEILEGSSGFSNPSNVEVLAAELGLSNYSGDSSLFTSLQNQYYYQFHNTNNLYYFLQHFRQTLTVSFF
jgi:hypothetical protein